MSTTHRKGSRWRHAVDDWLIDAGFTTSVRGIGWAGDDILARLASSTGAPPLALSVECKNHKEIRLASFVDQAAESAHCYPDETCLPIVVCHRPGRASVDDGYVIMSGATFVDLVTR